MRILCLLAGLTSFLSCQALYAQQPVIPIWGDEDPPYFKPHTIEEYEADCFEVVCAYQVSQPTLTLYVPENRSNDAAVLVLPGGGYEVEAVYHEGYEIAEALSRSGTVAAVLKYRLPSPETSTHPELAPPADVRQALALLRDRQRDFGFEAVKFGVMGFSAGAHLAATVSVNRVTHASRNPDFSMLIYGVSRLTEENQQWLESTLYHRPMTEEELARERLLERIDSNTPPAFLVHAWDDDVCHYSESTLYAEALHAAGVENEIHLFARGGHGFGAGRKEDGTDQWIQLAVNWLDRIAPIQAPAR
jgi:acetyl esterase/lipase